VLATGDVRFAHNVAMTFATNPPDFDERAPASVSAIPASALHPLDTVPDAAPWNLEELSDLLPAAPAMEAVVLVGLVPRDAGLRVLLTQRTEGLRHHAGQVSFPGGRIDQGDAGPVAAALREAEEEIGLRAQFATPMGFLDPLVTITGFRVLPVVARIAPEFVATPSPDEVAVVFEVDLDYLMHPDHLERVTIEYRGRQRHVLQFRNPPQAPHQRIWGVTASILFNFRERLARAEGATR
jgi:8-oxo-dGTP pyrophosphatase MutT (NUDIX family)